MKKRTGIFFGLITLCMIASLFWPDPTSVILNQELLEKPSPPSEYLPPDLNLPDNSKVLQAFGEQQSMSITSSSSINSTYEPTFIVRMENGNVHYLNASQINSYAGNQFNDIWGIGIRTRYGIVGFYSNDQDPTWGHTQLITYPVLNNGSLPPLNKPIMGTFLRLWVRTGGTWYRNFITSQPLFQANSIDPRRWMKAEETSDILELGWNATLELQGFDFKLYVGIQVNKTKSHNQVNIKTNITSLERNWDGLGLEYVIAQSSFWDNTEEQILYGTVESPTQGLTYKLNQFKDVTQEIPNRFNQTQLITRGNRTVHTFNWDDLRAVGFDTSLFRVENMELPNGEYDWVIRTGMYGIRNIPQGYTIEIDPVVTITDDSTAAIPLEIKRDSSDRIYVLGKNSTTTELVVWISTDSGSTWNDYTIGTARSANSDASLVIGSYSGTEYCWVVAQIGWATKVYRSTTGDTLSFSEIDSTTSHDHFSGSACLVGSTLYYVYMDNTDWDNFYIRKSTDGGDTTSQVTDAFYNGTTATSGSAITYDGTFLYMYWTTSGGSQTVYGKRLNITDDNVQYYNGASWVNSVDSDTGQSIGIESGLSLYSDSDSNIISVGGGGNTKAGCTVSTDGGESWTAVSGAGYQNHIWISTTVLANSSVIALGVDYDSSSNNIDKAIYSYSGSSWGSWAVIWDSGDASDSIDYTTINDEGGNVDFAYRWLADTNSTYHLQFNQYEASGVSDETDPTFSYVGTTNSSTVELGTSILGNWSITEVNPSIYIIYANTTGSNVSKTSGSYLNGDYKSWTFDNDLAARVGDTIFIQIWANDTSQNSASSIVYFTIEDTTDPTFVYAGTTNNTSIEYGTSIIGNWSITDLASEYYYIFSNSTGSNATKASGSYVSGNYYTWTFDNDVVARIGDTIFIQISANDTSSNSASSIVYFDIIDTTDPTFSYNGATNNTSVEYGTAITFNSSITELAPDTYIIYANTTGSNATKASGSYLNGDYKSWTFDNDLSGLVGDVIFIQMKANDTTGNSDSIITYFTIVDTTDPTFNYVGTTNNTSIEYGTSITSNTSVTDLFPDTYLIYSNTTGSNATKASDSYVSGNYYSWTFDNNLVARIGEIIFIQTKANDTSGNMDSIIVYFTIVDTTDPVFNYVGTTNNTSVDIGTAITFNSSITDLAPHIYLIYSNTTGSNATKASGSYSNGDYKSWQFSNNDCDLAGDVIFIQMKANDTTGNSGSIITYFTVNNDAPQLSYGGTSNNTAIEWETGGSFTVSWTITEDNPHLYILYWNQTGSNTTWASGTYTSALSKGYNPVLGDIGNVIWIQVVLNDTCSESTTEIYYFSVTNTAPPTITITRPEGVTYYTDLIEIWISSSNEDSDSLWWALHYANGTLYEGNVTYTESTSRTLPEASYTFKGYGNDTSGNEGISTVDFTISESGVVLGGPSSPKLEDTTQEPDPLGTPQPYLTQGFTVILVGLAIGSVWWVSENWKPEPTWNQVNQRKKFRKQVNQLKRYFNEQMKK